MTTAGMITLGENTNYVIFAGQMLSPKDVSEQYNIPTRTLLEMRKNGSGPLFQKLTPKIIRYCRSDIESWLKQQTKRFSQQSA